MVDRILAEFAAGTHEPDPARTLAEIEGRIPLRVSDRLSQFMSEKLTETISGVFEQKAPFIQKPAPSVQKRASIVQNHASKIDFDALAEGIARLAAMDELRVSIENYRAAKSFLAAAWAERPRRERRLWSRWTRPARMRSR